jgi:hypothetical protein
MTGGGFGECVSSERARTMAIERAGEIIKAQSAVWLCLCDVNGLALSEQPLAS